MYRLLRARRYRNLLPPSLLIVVAFASVAPANAGEEVAPPADPGGTVEVSSRQAVTVDGRFESLRALIEKVCEKSGVELRDYGAEDRAIVAHYDGLPLRKAFNRLLSEESFVLGMTKAEGASRPRITWVRVVSSTRSGGSGSAARPAPRAVTFPRSAYSSPNASVRRRSRAGFSARLGRDQAVRDRFLATSSNALAGPLVGQAYANEFLTELRRSTRDRRVQSKISQVHAVVRRRNQQR